MLYPENIFQDTVLGFMPFTPTCTLAGAPNLYRIRLAVSAAQPNSDMRL